MDLAAAFFASRREKPEPAPVVGMPVFYMHGDVERIAVITDVGEGDVALDVACGGVMTTRCAYSSQRLPSTWRHR
jgi:hypothetical protein